jgi:hypothetical protein
MSESSYLLRVCKLCGGCLLAETKFRHRVGEYRASTGGTKHWCLSCQRNVPTLLKESYTPWEQHDKNLHTGEELEGKHSWIHSAFIDKGETTGKFYFYLDGVEEIPDPWVRELVRRYKETKEQLSEMTNRYNDHVSTVMNWSFGGEKNE